MSRASVRKRRAITLVEVLVVIGLVGILMGLLLNAVQTVRASATRLSCSNNLRQLGLASTAYHDAHGKLPPSYMIQWRYSPKRFTLLSWTNYILPYIEQEGLWDTLPSAYLADESATKNPPHIGLTTVIKTYTCPADGRLSAPITDDLGYTAAYGSYLGVGPLQGASGDFTLPTAMARGGVRIAEVTDGTSQTLYIGERPPPGRALAGNWYTIMFTDLSYQYTLGLEFGTTLPVQEDSGYFGPCRPPYNFGPGRIENPCDSHHFWSLHSGGANFLFVDGSVHFLSYSAKGILPALASRAGGEVVPIPD
jgi:prepilin-type processing-associated H-X9-DG protein